MWRRTFWNNLVAVLISGLVGDFVGELLWLITPPGPVKNIVLKSVSFGIKPFTLDLLFFQIHFGLMFKLNIIAVLFIFLGIYLFRRL